MYKYQNTQAAGLERQFDEEMNEINKEMVQIAIALAIFFSLAVAFTYYFSGAL